VLVVLEADGDAALVSDMADEPIRIPRNTLEEARGRIKKFKRRLMSLASTRDSFDLETAVHAGIEACVHGLHAARGNFSLGALATWAGRLEDAQGKESWARTFPAGGHFWTGLTWTHDCIEHFGTGGGLCRPVFADFLAEAGAALDRADLTEAGARYREIGIEWSALADAALPADVPLFRKARELLARKSEVFHSEGGGGTDALAAIWSELAVLATEATECFPLSEPQCEALRGELARRVRRIHELETEALTALPR
jgi:hypothetical protein